jgi:hypothetical protein
MSRSVDRILEEAQALTPEERLRLRELLTTPRPKIDAQREDAARELFGKYAHAPTSSEEFCARKAAEISIEDR